MQRLIYLVKMNYFQIFLIIGIISITAINLNLRIKLSECSDNKLISNIEKVNMEVDSLEGFSLSSTLIENINNAKQISKNIGSNGMLIFTKPESSCGKCLLSILSRWFNDHEHNSAINLKPIVILNKDDYSFISALERLEYSENLLVKINANFVNYTTPKASQGVCLFINKKGKIIFAEELRTENTERITRTFKKIINYLKDASLNEYRQFSIPLVSKTNQ